MPTNELHGLVQQIEEDRISAGLGAHANPAIANVEVRLFDVLYGPGVITRGLSSVAA